MGIKGNDFV